MLWNRKPVVHPLAFAARRNDSSFAQVRQMARYLRLGRVQHFHEVANANLLFGHQIQKSQSRAVGQRGEQHFERDCFFPFCHDARISEHTYALTDVSNGSMLTTYLLMQM